MPTPAVEEVDWRKLSPHGRAILRWIAVPISTGLTHQEVADRLNVRRPTIPDLDLPPVVSAHWVNERMRWLRSELRS